MADAVQGGEPEDVISSIRKLVTQERTAETHLVQDRLVLSPAFRVRSEPQRPVHVPPTEGTVAEEEAAFISVDEDGEPEGAVVHDLRAAQAARLLAGGEDEDDLRTMDGAEESTPAAPSATAGGSYRAMLPHDTSGLRKLVSEVLADELQRDAEGPLTATLRALVRDEIARMIREDGES